MSRLFAITDDDNDDYIYIYILFFLCSDSVRPLSSSRSLFYYFCMSFVMMVVYSARGPISLLLHFVCVLFFYIEQKRNESCN